MGNDEWIPAGVVEVARGGYLRCEGSQVGIVTLVFRDRAEMLFRQQGLDGYEITHYRIYQPDGSTLHVRHLRKDKTAWIEEVVDEPAERLAV